jgi:6-phosphogluconolactonase
MIQIFANAQELARGAAEYFLARSREAVAEKGFFTVALSGGSTPKILYELLVSTQVPWTKIHFFWSDERHVPPDHPDSNYRMAYEAMLSRVPVPENNVHRVHGENPDAAKAAYEYEQTLLPLDLILLGLGTDGHTASINTYRITMTLPLLNTGASVLFLVSGAEKAEIVKDVIEGPKQYPAQLVQPTHGQLLWMLDKDAASSLDPCSSALIRG